MRNFYWSFFFVFFVLVIFFSQCRSSLITKKELDQWNANFNKKIFLVKTNLYLMEYNFKNHEFEAVSNQKLLDSGIQVKLLIEATDDWLRIRAFDLSKNQKEYMGISIFYLTVPPEEEITAKNIKEIIYKFIHTYFQSKVEK